MRNFISVKDVNDIQSQIDLAKSIKANELGFKNVGKDKTIALLFFNPSLRTRLSTQKAAMNLGMNVLVMDIGKDGWAIEFDQGTIMNQNKAEHIKEAAAVVSQYADIIGIRTFPTLQDRKFDYAETVIRAFLNYATIPIISLESATLHPLQSLADLLTIEEHKTQDRPKVVLSWAPHPRALPQAVANSTAEWMQTYDQIDFIITHPEGFELSPRFASDAQVIYDQETAFNQADFIYAKNWSSYSNYGQTSSKHDHWMITNEKMALTNEAYFMHCLPVRRNVVVADEVLDSSKSLVIEQANNRTYATQSVLLKILQDET